MTANISKHLVFWFLALGLSLGNAQSFLTNGLVAFYPFNGNARDFSGSGLHGTVNGATLTTNRFSTKLGAYQFDGQSAFIQTPLDSSAFTESYTVSVWFKADDFTNSWPTIMREDKGGFCLGVVGGSHLDHGKFYAMSEHATSGLNFFLRREETTPTNGFVHAVVTKLGGDVTLYWNGQVAGTVQATSSEIKAGSYLNIGRGDVDFNPADSFFRGVIDDIRVYDRALSANEVTQIYSYQLIPDTPTLPHAKVRLVKAVKPAFWDLIPAAKYQLQVTSDFIVWRNEGTPFTATETNMVYTQYWDTEDWGNLFFRLEVVE